uniref:Uncharacterized protein n=1 Tax=viral metagenome TaxID=1070528 RepID=A0A6C0BD09_9ZZZZ
MHEKIQQLAQVFKKYGVPKDLFLSTASAIFPYITQIDGVDGVQYTANQFITFKRFKRYTIHGEVPDTVYPFNYIPPERFARFGLEDYYENDDISCLYTNFIESKIAFHKVRIVCVKNVCTSSTLSDFANKVVGKDTIKISEFDVNTPENIVWNIKYKRNKNKKIVDIEKYAYVSGNIEIYRSGRVTEAEEPGMFWVAKYYVFKINITVDNRIVED